MDFAGGDFKIHSVEDRGSVFESGVQIFDE
jgi:hypothetical protein